MEYERSGERAELTGYSRMTAPSVGGGRSSDGGDDDDRSVDRFARTGEAASARGTSAGTGTAVVARVSDARTAVTSARRYIASEKVVGFLTLPYACGRARSLQSQAADDDPHGVSHSAPCRLGAAAAALCAAQRCCLPVRPWRRVAVERARAAAGRRRTYTPPIQRLRRLHDRAARHVRPSRAPFCWRVTEAERLHVAGI